MVRAFGKISKNPKSERSSLNSYDSLKFGTWTFFDSLLKIYNFIHISLVNIFCTSYQTCHISQICTVICLDIKYLQFVSKACVFCSQSGSENPIVSGILNKNMMFINLLHINHTVYLCSNCSYVISTL